MAEVGYVFGFEFFEKDCKWVRYNDYALRILSMLDEHGIAFCHNGQYEASDLESLKGYGYFDTAKDKRGSTIVYLDSLETKTTVAG